MPLATEPAQDAALDAVVSSLPSPATWRLHVDMPADTSTELAPDGGYAAVGYSAGDWAAASEGAKEATVDFGTSTDAWSDVATYWAIHDARGRGHPLGRADRARRGLHRWHRRVRVPRPLLPPDF